MKKFKEKIENFIVDTPVPIILIIFIIFFAIFIFKESKPKYVEKYGRFIPIEEGDQYYDNFGRKHYQTLVYDKDTKIIYIYDLSTSPYSGGVTISPFYCMNSNDEPVIAVFDMEEVE